MNSFGGDRTSFIDRVTVSPAVAAATGVIPDASAVTVAAAGILDLNGGNEAVGSLAGAGAG